MIDQQENESQSDLETREQALSAVRDALAGVRTVPAAGLDPEKNETLTDSYESLLGLEKSLQNEVDQMRDSE